MTVATNRRARRDYHVVDEYEAGLVLKGSEVKSLRAGQVDLKDSHVVMRDGEAWLVGMRIAHYSHARDGGHDPERDRKLLLHRHELRRLTGKLAEQGLTLVPARVFFREGKAKVDLILGKGRPKYDKRRLIREREEKREMDRALRQKGRRS